MRSVLYTSELTQINKHLRNRSNSVSKILITSSVEIFFSGKKIRSWCHHLIYSNSSIFETIKAWMKIFPRITRKTFTSKKKGDFSTQTVGDWWRIGIVEWNTGRNQGEWQHDSYWYRWQYLMKISYASTVSSQTHRDGEINNHLSAACSNGTRLLYAWMTEVRCICSHS